MSTDEILNLKMRENDADAETVREYLVELLLALWHEGEQFSGKRPFGNSGWDHELFRALINAKAIDGTLDEDGFIVDFDRPRGERLITEAIKVLA